MSLTHRSPAGQKEGVTLFLFEEEPQGEVTLHEIREPHLEGCLPALLPSFFILKSTCYRATAYGRVVKEKGSRSGGQSPFLKSKSKAGDHPEDCGEVNLAQL